MDEKGLGQRLQDARKAAGFTQQSLCHKAGLSYSTLAKIERGAIKAPSIFTVQIIAEALGVRLDELLGTSVAGTPKGSTKMISESGVKFVYFDVNGCLVRSYHRAFTRLAVLADTSPDVVESAFWHYNDQVCRGKMSMADFNAALAVRLHLPKVDWAQYYLEEVEPIPEMQELVHWTSERYRVGLLTNIMPGLLDAMLARGILPNVAYDTIIDSSQTGSIKPEHKIYELAQERSAVKSSEILLIDDTRANLMAAERLEWHVLWFDDYRPNESVERVRTSLKSATSL